MMGEGGDHGMYHPQTQIDFLSTASWQRTCANHTERAHVAILKPGGVALYTIAIGFRDRFSNHVHPCLFACLEQVP